jgi:hypothetical protein
MNSDFKDFLNSQTKQIPEKIKNSLHNRILNEIRIDNTPLLNIFLKYFIINLAAGSLTLLICPQFGIGPLNGSHGVSHYFMQFGGWACGLFCASVFFVSSHLFSLAILHRRELRRLYRNPSSIPLTIALTLFIFMSTGFTINFDPMFFRFDFIATWIFAGLALTYLSFEARFRFIQR